MTDDKFAARLGAALRSLRSSAGLSQEGFADSISMHRAYYSSIERGEKNITIGTLARLADGLNVKVSEVFELAGL
ncbi:helix-turn-helix transcriptional regulator (plasmid) [Xanthomonas campestris pv. campestris]|uniref:helix-turn-helix domain-containing protein n=1 Tax=Xanthomonas TaxID=338 RepID=UPI0004A27883|nr:MULTISPECIES: helix-turn-helix transcriptional regulator [Xanthomonas]MCC8913242.1 helix-turn-helix domain-containing protein [Xanthomonas euvesicatoria]MCE4518118.1 helix-turn-helix domain-containing protein [Xanthomonas hortorum pv. vitians]QTK49550.1 helix-turn-helix transcriptional regulator [Xanthomonas euvesicatoria pv. alfalfae]WDJ74887.1 helix-turn-helix transcriptional regulator [Xanthomonas campestris pv. campestris]